MSTATAPPNPAGQAAPTPSKEEHAGEIYLRAGGHPVKDTGLPLRMTNPQGVSPENKTWTPPAVDGTLNIPEMIEHHAEKSKDHPVAVWEPPLDVQEAPGEDRRGKVTYAEYNRAIHRGARAILNQLGQKDPVTSVAEAKNVAILAAIDNFTYTTINHAIMRTGHVSFPISTRNSVLAIVHLLRKTGTRDIVTGGGDAMTNTVRAVEEEWARQLTSEGKDADSVRINVMQAPRFETLYPQFGPQGKEEDEFEYLPKFVHRGEDDLAMIMHSSGSTAFPKPIPYTHGIFVCFSRFFWYGNGDMCGQLNGTPSLPGFHALGIWFHIMAPLTTGSIPGLFRPGGPATVPTPEVTLRAVKRTRSTMTVMVPSFLEEWSKDEEAMKYLSTLQLVMFGGGPLPHPVGERLVSRNVQLHTAYGATEFSSPAKWELPPRGSPPSKDWEYFSFNPQQDMRLRPQDDGSGNYELILVANDVYSPAVYNIEGERAYASSDLIARHPTNPELWKVVGRLDDQIMLSTGEKTNPGPIEGIITESPLVSHAVMFGRARAQNGILIEPSPGHEFDPRDEKKLAEFRNAIWPVVERANEFSPQHSRLFKEMIAVAHPDKPFVMTPKRTVIRKRTLAAYEDEIERIYSAAETSAEVAADVEPPKEWNKEETKNFVAQVVARVMEGGKKERRGVLDEEADLFLNGVDSLQATYIRNSILSALRKADVPTASIPPNVVFQNPTIASLASFISAIAQSPDNEDVARSVTAGDKVQLMKEAIDKYTADLPAHTPDPALKQPPKDEEVVILTGSTGGLGSHLLAQLVETPSVKRIYALNRRSPSGRSLRERQVQTLDDRLGRKGAGDEVLSSEKVHLIEGDIEREDLGISPNLFNEIRTSTTLIIHNAWRLDFNIALSSFTPQLESVSNLARLAIRSPLPIPPRILFTSSIATVSSWTSPDPVPEEPLEDLRVAVGNGYGEGKAVGEKILEIVAQRTSVKTTNVRIGQLSGSTPSGAWATTDWVPLLVRSGQEMGILPDGGDPVSWLPVDIAASALIEFRRSSFQTLHIVNPRRVSWHDVLQAVSDFLNIPLVPYQQWLDRLEQSAADPNAGKTNPAVNLLDFFRHGRPDTGAPGREAMGMTELSTKKATSESESLRNARPIDREEVKKWLDYWRSKNFLK